MGIIINTIFPGIGIETITIRRSHDRLIFIIGIPIPVRQHFYAEKAFFWFENSIEEV